VGGGGRGQQWWMWWARCAGLAGSAGLAAWVGWVAWAGWVGWAAWAASGAARDQGSGVPRRWRGKNTYIYMVTQRQTDGKLSPGTHYHIELPSRPYPYPPDATSQSLTRQACSYSSTPPLPQTEQPIPPRAPGSAALQLSDPREAVCDRNASTLRRLSAAYIVCTGPV